MVGESVVNQIMGLGETMMGEGWMNQVVDKLKEVLVWIKKLVLVLIGKFDEVFPPETRAEKLHHWLEVGMPVAVTVGLLLFCCWCCRCFCCRGGRIRTMKAPGRGYRIRRDVFEANPRSYFRSLRGSQ